MLARVLAISSTEGTEVDLANDHMWHRIVDMVLAPYPALSEGARRVIELDYSMTNGEVHLSLSAGTALLHLKRLGRLTYEAANPSEQQIILANRDAVQPLIDEALGR